MFRYVQAQDGGPLPDIGELKPFKASVVIEGRPSPEWQARASRWLVDSGCPYMMAWGDDCGSWDDSVDWANLAAFDHGDIPHDEDVMTTWHENEPLEDAFRFAKRTARHPAVRLDNMLVINIGGEDKRAKIEKMFSRV